jgi:hypothetical protein
MHQRMLVAIVTVCGSGIEAGVIKVVEAEEIVVGIRVVVI